MTKEELLKKIDFEKSWLCDCGIFGSDVDIAFHAIKKSVIEALEQEPCYDAISRQAVLDAYVPSKHMNVLVACEESQIVCLAFRERGHRAYSCDILDCSGGHPEWHIKGGCVATD